MNSIAIMGKPNTGKSLLFNRLTGMNQRVANFPGVTTEIKSGQTTDFSLVDFPGAYTFQAITRDEQVAVERFEFALDNKKIQTVLCVLDATQLSASLRMALEVRSRANHFGVPVVFAVNMMDEIKSLKLHVDIEGLGKALDAPIFAISARTGEGIKDLGAFLRSPKTDQVPTDQNENFDFYQHARELALKFGPQTDLIVAKKNKLDRFFLSSTFGGLLFAAIMLFLFQAIFTWAGPFMDFIENSIAWASEATTGGMADGLAKDFLNDAIFGGLGSFLVFVPQIFFLTFIVGVLEDSGYLARAALICHRPLKFFGMSGKSFIPLLTGHACAIPAIIAARSVDSPKKRILTILAVPLMSCSARLPVYGLLISAFIPSVTVAGGLFGLQGLAFFGIFGFSIVAALVVTSLLSRTTYKDETDLPFVLELPSYRLPHWKPLLIRSVRSAYQFVSKAGAIIFTVTVVVWALGYFPNGSGHLDTSFLAVLGKAIEPVLAPLGLDWKYGVAILTSFLAREVFVGVLGTMFGIEAADENVDSLIDTIHGSGLTFASGMALLVFYAIAMQCVSTLAVIKQELGNYKAPILIFIGYSLAAYLCAWATYLVLN